MQEAAGVADVLTEVQRTRPLCAWHAGDNLLKYLPPPLSNRPKIKSPILLYCSRAPPPTQQKAGIEKLLWPSGKIKNLKPNPPKLPLSFPCQNKQMKKNMENVLPPNLMLHAV